MNFSYFFAFTALAISAISAQGQINTVPEGVTTYSLPATAVGQNTTSYYSVPLSNDPAYTGAVSTVAAATITIADSPWTANQFTTAPYFVKFLSGLQSGRVIKVVSNTANTLTLDTSDNSAQVVPLNTTNFSVASPDTFEVFAGDTLASLFGVNTQQSPLVLQGGTSVVTSDTVSIYNASLLHSLSYYFDTTAGFWKMYGSSANANNTVVYPYSAFAITRRSGEAATSFTLMGRVPEVTRLIKTTGSNSVIYNSTGYPVDMELSQLDLGANWTQGTNVVSADTLSVWNNSLQHFDTYFQMPAPDATWRKYGAGTTDESDFVIPAGTAVIFDKRGSASGSTSYLQPTLPYSLD